MLHPNSYVVRAAVATDGEALRRLAELDSARPLHEPVLLGEIDGAVAAAVSLHDGRAVADPFRHTASLVSTLRMRAAGVQAHEAVPSLRERLRAALAPVAPAAG
jgi:hypothetical protein